MLNDNITFHPTDGLRVRRVLLYQDQADSEIPTSLPCMNECRGLYVHRMEVSNQ